MNFEKYDRLQAELGCVGDNFRYITNKRLPNQDETTKILIEEIGHSLDDISRHISQALQATIDE